MMMSEFSDLIIIPGSTPETEHYPENHDSPPSGRQLDLLKNPSTQAAQNSVYYYSSPEEVKGQSSEICYEIRALDELEPTQTLNTEQIVLNSNNSAPPESLTAAILQQREPKCENTGASNSRKAHKSKNEPENFAVDKSKAEKVFQFIDLHEDNFVSQNENIRIELVNEELWNKFSAVSTEMIVTKSGRRIFPQISLEISGFKPTDVYSVYIYFKPTDQNSWKFSGGSWKIVGKNQQLPRETMLCRHPSSPAEGKFWNRSEEISFAKVKLTNNKQSKEKGQIILNSMSFYQPQLVIINETRSGFGSVKLTMEKLKFVAVTAYQNSAMTQLKIDHNPFAKGFRDAQEKSCLMSALQAQLPRMPFHHLQHPMGHPIMAHYPHYQHPYHPQLPMHIRPFQQNMQNQMPLRPISAPYPNPNSFTPAAITQYPPPRPPVMQPGHHQLGPQNNFASGHMNGIHFQPSFNAVANPLHATGIHSNRSNFATGFMPSTGSAITHNLPPAFQPASNSTLTANYGQQTGNIPVPTGNQGSYVNPVTFQNGIKPYPFPNYARSLARNEISSNLGSSQIMSTPVNQQSRQLAPCNVPTGPTNIPQFKPSFSIENLGVSNLLNSEMVNFAPSVANKKRQFSEVDHTIEEISNVSSYCASEPQLKSFCYQDENFAPQSVASSTSEISQVTPQTPEINNINDNNACSSTEPLHVSIPEDSRSFCEQSNATLPGDENSSSSSNLLMPKLDLPVISQQSQQMYPLSQLQNMGNFNSTPAQDAQTEGWNFAQMNELENINPNENMLHSAQNNFWGSLPRSFLLPNENQGC